MNDGGARGWATALVVGAALSVVVAACSSDDADQSSQPTSSTTSSSIVAPSTTVDVAAPTSRSTSNAVFDARSDDLCESVTGDDVVEFLTAAGAEVEGPAVDAETAVDPAVGSSCAWMLGSGEEIQLGAVTTPLTAGVSSRLAAMQQLDMITDYEQPGDVMSPGAVVSGHPQLSDGVVVENEGFLRFNYYTPEGENRLSLTVFPEGGEIEDPDGTPDRYEAIVMATAELILEQLRWVDS